MRRALYATRLLVLVALLFLCLFVIAHRKDAVCDIHTLVANDQRMPDGWTGKWAILPPAHFRPLVHTTPTAFLWSMAIPLLVTSCTSTQINGGQGFTCGLNNKYSFPPWGGRGQTGKVYSPLYTQTSRGSCVASPLIPTLVIGARQFSATAFTSLIVCKPFKPPQAGCGGNHRL